LTVVKQSPLAFLSALDHGIFTSILGGTLSESAEHKYNITTIQYKHKIQGHYKIYVTLIKKSMIWDRETSTIKA